MTQSTRDAVSVSRYLLSGGTAPWRLPWRWALMLVFAGSTLSLGIVATSDFARPTGWAGPASATVAVIAMALMLAVTATRWLGRTIGLTAGLIYLSTMLAGGMIQPAGVDAVTSASMTAAVLVFAVASVPGRLPLCRQRWPAPAFYLALAASWLAGGATACAVVLCVVVAFLLISQDPRGLRFFADRQGMVLFVILLGGALLWRYMSSVAKMTDDGEWIGLLASGGFIGQHDAAGVPWTVAAAMLPWAPLVLLTGILGLRGGHYATPIWRLVGCWLVAPIVLAVGGVARPELGATVIGPPMAVIASVGLLATWRLGRRMMARRSGRHR